MQLILSNDIINLIENYNFNLTNEYLELLIVKFSCSDNCRKELKKQFYSSWIILHRFCECIHKSNYYYDYISKLGHHTKKYRYILPKKYYYTSGLNSKCGYKNE